MLDNPILQVVTGLTFLYLIYSLLATIVKEFIASFFSYRSRMLELGIQQMVDGHQISYYWWDKMINLLIWFFSWIGWIAKWLVDQLRIYVANKRNRKEEYSKKWNLPHPGKLRAFLTAEPAHKHEQHPYRRRKLNKKAKMFAAKVTGHPLYKRSGETNWIKQKKPAYLPANTFSDILIDLFSSQAQKIAGTKVVLMKNITDYIHAHFKDNQEFQNIMDIYAEQSNGDLNKFNGLLNNWFDDTMDRVSGWYKKQVNLILFIIGLGLALAFNIDTIEIIEKLSTDPTARAALVQSASKYIDAGYAQKNQDNKKQPDTTDVRMQVNSMKDLYANAIQPTNNLLGLGWTDQKLVPKTAAPLWQYCDRNFSRAIVNPLYQSVTKPVILLGFILTALAISLGAPFWFDLLNKLVNLRAAGTKPDKSASATGKTDTLTKKPDPSAKG